MQTAISDAASHAAVASAVRWQDGAALPHEVPAAACAEQRGRATAHHAATIGQPAWFIWIVAILIGFAQCFTYAEISGLYPHKSGGASVYGALGWVRYSKFVAPVSVWCNWIAWSPMLALGTSLAAGYMLSCLFPANSVVNTWHLTLLDLGFITKGLTLRINATFLLAMVFLLVAFKLQHSGPRSATPVSSATRRRTPTRRFSRRVCCACSCSSWCQSRSRVC